MKETKPDLSSSAEDIDRMIEAYIAGGRQAVGEEFDKIFPPLLPGIKERGMVNWMSKEEREKEAADPELQAKIRRIRAAFVAARLDR